ncbi:MAG TPA: hypothetical protein VFX64_05875 [Candidatus Nitrosotalea sp.]|nr:hypothetical protein [Candidatus Nitrosotalea sp.]
MKTAFTDDQLRAQILYYLWNQGSWSEIYTNLDKMTRRLSNIVKNNGKNTMKKIENLVKWNWVLPRKNWDTISLNPVYKSQIKQYIDEYLIK